MDAPNVAILLGLAALVAAVGDEVARGASRRIGWAAAGGFVLIAAAPLVPNYTILLGFSLDDTLPLLGLAMLIPLVPWRRLRQASWAPPPGPAVAAVGVGLMVVAGLISATFVGGNPVDAFRLAVRGPGRVLFLAAVVVVIAVLGSTDRSRAVSARVIAAIGIFEAGFGLVAYFVGFPLMAGLEATRDSSVLSGAIPGRISGTLGISPNFTAAILMITTLVTAGLALQAPDRRGRAVWWAAVVLQLGAITLTYTRVSLGLVVVSLVVLVLLRSRPILLIPIVAVLGAVAVLTPTLSRIVSDVPDRLALWTSAFLLMIDNPFTGVGPGETLAVIAQNPERYRQTVFGQAWSTAHNTVLLAGAETGVLGAVGALILNIGLVLVVLRALMTAERGPAGSLQVASALALGAFLAQGMVNNLISVGATGLFAATLVGSLLIIARGVPVPATVDVDGVARPRGWLDLVPRRWRHATQPATVAMRPDGG